jgi:hypothetical protein
MKRWLSELRELDARSVHQLREVHPLDLLGYLNSIVDHNEQFHSARQRYEPMRWMQARTSGQGGQRCMQNACEQFTCIFVKSSHASAFDTVW